MPSATSPATSASDLANGAADSGRNLVKPVLTAVLVGSFVLIVLICLTYYRFCVPRKPWAAEGLAVDPAFNSLTPPQPEADDPAEEEAQSATAAVEEAEAQREIDEKAKRKKKSLVKKAVRAGKKRARFAWDYVTSGAS